MQLLNPVKCKLTELTTKSDRVPLEVNGIDTFAHVSEIHVLVDRSIAWRTYRRRSLAFCSVAAYRTGSSPPTPFPLFQQCDGCLSCYSGFVQVMENLESHGIYKFHFQAWKVMELNSRSLKVIEN